MNSTAFRLSFLVVVVIAARCALAEDSAAPDKKSSDEAAIRKSVESYAAAFNRGDAKAIAAQWSEAGSYVSSSGERLEGRAAIQRSFETLFQENKGRRVEVINPTIRFPTADVAVEEGMARVIGPDGAVDESTYIAIHVKQKGEWFVESIRETETPAAPPAQSEELEQLSWMVGEWVDHSDDSTIETHVRWTKNKAFLTCSFHVSVPGIDPLEGTQVIGWDAAAGTLRSWVFDTDGAVMQGVWTRKDNRWIVKSTGVLADGTTASSTNVYTMVDGSNYKWRSFGRKAGNESLPDISEVTVKRTGTADSTKSAPAEKNTPSKKTSSNKD